MYLDSLPQLSVRSRALLKRYFEESDAFRLPEGHPVLAFTESQVYKLLRVVTDETIRMSIKTMERMVLDAVKGAPTTAPSRNIFALETGLRPLDQAAEETGVLQTLRVMRHPCQVLKVNRTKGNPHSTWRLTVPQKWPKIRNPSNRPLLLCKGLQEPLPTP